MLQESESKSRLTGKPKKTTSKDQPQGIDEPISRDALSLRKSEDAEDFDSAIAQCDSSSDYSSETSSPTSDNSSPVDEGYANLYLPPHFPQYTVSDSSKSSPVYGPLPYPQLYCPCSDCPNWLQGGAYPANGQPEPISQLYAEEVPRQDGMWPARAEGHMLMSYMEADISPVAPSSSSSWSENYLQVEGTIQELNHLTLHEHSGYLSGPVTEQQVFEQNIASVHYNPQVAADISVCHDINLP